MAARAAYAELKAKAMGALGERERQAMLEGRPALQVVGEAPAALRAAVDAALRGSGAAIIQPPRLLRSKEARKNKSAQISNLTLLL